MSAPTSVRRFPPRRGLTLIGLLGWMVVIGFAGLMVLRVVPSVLEFYAIQHVVDRMAAGEMGRTVAEMRAGFDRHRDTDVTITTLRGSDLDITKEDNQVVVRFAYDSEIELVKPVYLMIKYEGRSKPR
ncbi:MAG: hypothetical protein RLY78_947 [Pseudomonadota bacterium]|uniref:DUF4845 domain-containing protein n=1 Tax=Pseudaquabacterium rugosum TaxID=2984194 RepID=A0ABU9B571_9BURK